MPGIKSTTFLLTSVVTFSLMLNVVHVSADFRNFYGICWRGNPCDHLIYAKHMGYDYVAYMEDMELCPNADNIMFYIDDPEYFVYPGGDSVLDYNGVYGTQEIYDHETTLAWNATLPAPSQPFPHNIHAGWRFDDNRFRPEPDWQQQAVMDYFLDRLIEFAREKEDLSIGFEFGGYIWDSPGPSKLDPDDSSYLPNSKYPHLTHEYTSFKEAWYEYLKRLFVRTKTEFPGAKVISEPWKVYENWLWRFDNSRLTWRTDGDELRFDMVGQEAPGTDFVDDQDIFNLGALTTEYTPEYVESTTPDVFSHIGTDDDPGNLVIAAKAAINGAWFNWFGRWGGTGEMTGDRNYDHIYEVPARLKLIRVVASWDNLVGVRLQDRSWNDAAKIYQSTNSYADEHVIYSRHPDTGKLFVVFLDTQGVVTLMPGESVTSVQRTDGFFMESGDGSADIDISGNEARINRADKTNDEPDDGYILMLSSSENYIVDTDFESGTLEGWSHENTRNYPDNSPGRLDSPGLDSSGYAMLFDAADKGTHEEVALAVQYPQTLSENHYFEARIKPAQLGRTIGINMRDVDNEQIVKVNIGGYFSEGSQNQIQAIIPDPAVPGHKLRRDTGLTFTANEEFVIRTQYNYADGTFNVWKNGDAGNGVTWEAVGGADRDMRYIDIDNENGEGQCWVDDVIVDTISEISQTCLQLGGVECCTGTETCPGADLGAASDCSGICCSQACQTPETGDLVAHWTFDSQDISGGQALDISGNGYHGTISGATPAGGRVGEALYFDGQDDTVDVGWLSGNVNESESFTVAAWVMPNELAQGPDASYQKQIINLGRNTPALYMNQGQHWSLLFYGNDNGWHMSDSSNGYLTEQWRFLAGTYDGGHLRLYVDGELANEVEFSGYELYQRDVSGNIGSFDAERFFNGTIDEVIVWNRSLSAQEILDIYDSFFHRADDNPKDGCVEQHELISFIDNWKYDSNSYPMSQMMEAVTLYYIPIILECPVGEPLNS